MFEIPTMTKNRIIILLSLSWSIFYLFLEWDYELLFYVMPFATALFFLWKFDDVDFKPQEEPPRSRRSLGPEIIPHDIQKPKWENIDEIDELRRRDKRW